MAGLTPWAAQPQKKVEMMRSVSFPAYHYRLPTEEELEHAMNGGNKSKGYIYSGNNLIGGVAWYHGNAGNKTHTVSSWYGPNLGYDGFGFRLAQDH